MNVRRAFSWLALAIAFCHSNFACTCNFMYSELLQLGGSCYPHDSCSTLKATTDDNLWNSRTCECGQHCVPHRTCCIDSPYVGLHPDITFRENEECQKVQTSSKTVVMVSHCSSRWAVHSLIYNKCEESHDLEDPVAEVPVTSLATATTYKNYFCAVCNYDSERAIFWDISIRKDPSTHLTDNEGDFLNEITYSSDQQAWGVPRKNPVTKQANFQEVKLEFMPPPSLLKIVKKCYTRTISRCNSMQWDDDLLEKCLSYYAPVKMRATDNRFAKYRNVHCATCNGVNVSQVDVDICRLNPERRKQRPSFSFALLLDVNQGDGQKVGRMQTCKDGQVFDPFFKKCRSMTCALPGYVVKDGVCTKT